MAASDVYPAALFDLYGAMGEANELAMAAHAIEDRLGALIESLNLYPQFPTEEEGDAYWCPFFKELERREKAEA
jgi:hypothetical protein